MTDDQETIPPSAGSSVPPEPASFQLKPGDRVGNYVIREQIGEGGFAVVYAAEQEKPVRRKVALKIIKLGMDTKQVIARFEAERQALAMMDHPNVAKVFDAGMTEMGRPYFVMEYVAGTSITEYCDRSRLSIGERLRLFTQVCSAVQHAHQKAIIHRDIKPSNVLVSDQGGEPLVRVIDFGVAKAISHRLAEQTIYTEQGQLVGTPAYMSPEQSGLNAENVDTRSDIYSLGVLLYKLLTGVLPFPAIEGRRFDAIRRKILEEDPPKPSTRLSNLGERSTAHAQKCRVEARSLVRRLRGDLDWVTMKAMEKDRTRRYATASEFAADLARHLHDEPVLAGPPSAVYRVRKYVRRHRMGVTVGAALTVGLPALLLVWGLREVNLRERAENEADKAKEMNVFLQDILAAANPWENKGPDVKVVDVLDGAAAELETKFDDRPAIKASLHATLGWTYKQLGWPDKGEPHLEQALLLREANNAPLAELAQSAHELAAVKWDLAQFEQAAELYRRALAMRQELVIHARGDPDAQLAVAETTSHLASSLDWMDKSEEAEMFYRQALHIRELVPEDHRGGLTLWGSGMSWVSVQNNLAMCLLGQGKLDEAERYLRAVAQALQPEAPSPRLAAVMGNLGWCLWDKGELEEAQTLLKSAVAMKREVLRPDDRRLAISLHDLGRLHLQRGAPAEAEPLLREALKIRRARFTDQDGRIARTESLLGDCLLQLDRLDEAEVLLANSYPILDAEYPAAEMTQRALQKLIDVYERLGRSEQAAALRAKLPTEQAAVASDPPADEKQEE